MSPETLTVRAFPAIYETACTDVLRFITDDRLVGLSKHNPGWRPERQDLHAYLRDSVERYVCALELVQRRPGGLQSDATVIDVGGFIGAFPLALARSGLRVSLAERYDYYDGAFDDLRDYLAAEGIAVIDADYTEPGQASERFDVVLNMAVLEHLAHTPRPMMDNLRASLTPSGALILDTPNLGFWRKRLGMLAGKSPWPPLRDLYEAEIPFTGHHREYTRSELAELVRLAGMRVEELVTLNYTPLRRAPILARPVLEWPGRWVPAFREVLMVMASSPELPSQG